MLGHDSIADRREYSVEECCREGNTRWTTSGIVTTKKWPDNGMRLENDGTEELRMQGCVHIADAEDALVEFFQNCRKSPWCWM